jgi:hypothetical protein
MTIAQRVGELHQQYEQLQGQRDFLAIARVLMLSKGKIPIAESLAKTTSGISQRVCAIFGSPDCGQLFGKAVVPPHSPAGNTAFAEYRVALAGFAAALQNIGVFDFRRDCQGGHASEVRTTAGTIMRHCAREIYGPTLRARSRTWPRRKWGPARAEAAPGRVATEGADTGRACPQDRPPRDGGVPRKIGQSLTGFPDASGLHGLALAAPPGQFG